MEPILKAYVIEQTAKRYAKMQKEYLPWELGISRQVAALAEVLTEETNARLDELCGGK